MPIPGEYIIFGTIGIGLVALIVATQRSRRQGTVRSGGEIVASAALSSALSGNVPAASIAVVAAAKAQDNDSR
ncbi:MAG: hypothetical protein WC050_02450 [Candidatus Paceibacterota bacterium]